MAWIEAHDTLPDHPKVLRAAKALRLDSDALVGKLLRLWTWALSNREDGVLSDLDAGVLHRIMNYSGKADKLLTALTEVRLLDALPDVRYAIHYWDEHVAMLMEQRDRKRTQARERQRRRRAAGAAPEARDVTPEEAHRSAPEERDEDAPCHAPVTRDTSVTQPPSVTRDVTRDVTPCHAVTVPNRTVPYIDDPIDDPAVSPRACARERRLVEKLWIIFCRRKSGRRSGRGSGSAWAGNRRKPSFPGCATSAAMAGCRRTWRCWPWSRR